MFPEIVPDAEDWNNTEQDAPTLNFDHLPPVLVALAPAAPDVAAEHLAEVWKVLAGYGMKKADVATPAAALQLLLSSVKATMISPDDWEELTAERDLLLSQVSMLNRRLTELEAVLEDMRRAELPRGMHHKSDVVAWFQMKAAAALKESAE